MTAAGALGCWGRDFYGEQEANFGTGRFIATTTKAYEVCALRDDQSFGCWGVVGMDTGALLVPPTGTAN